jgi:hypothetical protein
MYLILYPLSAISIYKKVMEISESIKERNFSKAKANSFLLFLMICVLLAIVWIMESI